MKLRTNLLFTILTMYGLASKAQNNQQTSFVTSVGLEAGTTTSGTGGNTFFGYRAGKLSGNTSYYNTFIGNNAGKNNTTGSQNTLVGNNAGPIITTGSGNTFLGNSAGPSCTTGQANTFIGPESGYANNGSLNIFVGSGSGVNNTGSNSILLGTGTAGENYYGGDNIMIGHYAGYNSGDSSNNIFIGHYSGYDEMGGSKLHIEGLEDNTPLIWGDFANDQLKFNAKVGVGYGFGNYPTTTGGVDVSGYNLFVKGGILTEEVRVSLQNTWADYVFKKDYKLPTLKEVENHITQKGHLINVPSAEEIKNNGIELGEMAKIQQEKIEELTLYIIEQNKINEKQAKELEKQNQEIQELKRMINQILNKK